MKVPVASKKQKVLQILLAILVLIPTVLFFVYNSKNLFETRVIVLTFIFLALAVAVLITTCITLFSHVVIDENGITLRRGIIKVNHISWEAVRRVEIFKALHRRSMLFSDTYVRISTTEEESYAYEHKISPLNLEADSISFAYDTQADDLLKRYYKGDIYR